MPRKQTRRSISVRGTTYENLRRFCDSTERSMSEIVEEQLARLFDNRSSLGRPAPIDARAIIQARVRAPKGDYRTVRF